MSAEILPMNGQKPLNWKKERVNYFLQKFEKEQKRRCPVGYPALMRMLTVYAEFNWSYCDEDNGGEIEFEIPPIEEWKEQVDGFFKDDFAGQQRGFHFSYLLKQYGSFTKYNPSQDKQFQENFYVCEGCKEKVKRTNRDSHRYNCKAGLDYWIKKDTKTA